MIMAPLAKMIDLHDVIQWCIDSFQYNTKKPNSNRFCG